jgi:hypothetical protein
MVIPYVSPGDLKRVIGDVGRIDSRIFESVGKQYREASGACAKIERRLDTIGFFYPWRKLLPQ